eukprot:403359206
MKCIQEEKNFLIGKDEISSYHKKNYFYLTVIICNSIILAMDDPTDTSIVTWRDQLDTFFSVLYFFEFFLKIFGQGFIFNKGAYLRDYWNILDFMVVIQMVLQILIETGLKLQVLRAFRVLRPLRTITSIEGLKLLVSALISALPLLRDTIIILLFFFFIFAIGALQVLSGDLTNRCFNLETGRIHKLDLICGATTSCPPGYICGMKLLNPNMGVSNFDNIFYSLLTIFQGVTLEGWSYIMLYVMKSTHYLVFLIFIPIVFVGAFFLLNLTLAVINYKFTEAHKFYLDKKKLENSKRLRQQYLDSLNMKNLRLANYQNDDDDFDDNSGSNQGKKRFDISLSLQQYIIAKKAARVMVQFLRRAQKNRKSQQRKQLINQVLINVFCCRCKKHRSKEYKLQSQTSQNFDSQKTKLDEFQFEKISINFEHDKSTINDNSFSAIYNHKQDFIDKINNQHSNQIRNNHIQNERLKLLEFSPEKQKYNMYNGQSMIDLTIDTTTQETGKKNLKSLFSNKPIQDKNMQVKKTVVIREEPLSCKNSDYIMESENLDSEDSNGMLNIIVQRPVSQNLIHRKRLVQHKKQSSQSNQNLNEYFGIMQLKQIQSNFEIQDIKSNSKLRPISRQTQRRNQSRLQNQQSGQFLLNNQEIQPDGLNFYNVQEASQNEVQQINNYHLFEESSDEFEILRRDNEISLKDDSSPNNLINQDAFPQALDFQSETSLGTQDYITNQKKRKVYPKFNPLQLSNSLSSNLKSSLSSSSQSIEFENSVHERNQRQSILQPKQTFQESRAKNAFQNLRLVKQLTEYPAIRVQPPIEEEKKDEEYDQTMNMSQNQMLLFDTSQQSQSKSDRQVNKDWLRPVIYAENLNSNEQFHVQSPLLIIGKNQLEVPNFNSSYDSELVFKESTPQALNYQQEQQNDIESFHDENQEQELKIQNFNDNKRMNQQFFEYKNQEVISRKGTGIVIRAYQPEEKHSSDNLNIKDMFQDSQQPKKSAYNKAKQKSSQFFERILPNKNMKSSFQQKFSLAHLISKKQKVILSNTKPEYFSSSQIDILERRLKNVSQEPSTNFTIKTEFEDDDFPDPNKFRSGVLRPKCKPHQFRVIYTIKEDALSNEIINRLVEKEEFQHLREQPFETATNMGYRQYYDNSFIRGTTKISDLYVTSTLSFTLIPKEQQKKEEVVQSSPKSSQTGVIWVNDFNYKQNLIPKEFQEDQIDGNSYEEIMVSASSFQTHSNISMTKSNVKRNNNFENMSLIESQESFSSSSSIEGDLTNQNKSRIFLNNLRESNTIKSNQNGQFQIKVTSSPIQNEKAYFEQFNLPHSVKENSKQISFKIDNNSDLRNEHSLEYVQRLSSQGVSYLTIPKASFPLNKSLEQSEENKRKPKSSMSVLSRIDSNPGRIKDLVDHAIQLSNIRKTRRASFSQPIKFMKKITQAQPLKRKQNTQKEYLKQKEKLDQLNLDNIQDFFEGNFYSSDEEEKQSRSLTRQNLEYGLTSKKITLNEENLQKFDQVNQNKDQIIMSSIKKIVSFKQSDPIITSKEIQKKQDSSQKWEDVSDVPTSLLSDYEDIKFLREQHFRDENHSAKFTSIINSIQSISQQNYMDFLILRKRDLNKKKQYTRWSGQNVLQGSMSDEKAKYVANTLNQIRVWPQYYGFMKILKNRIKALTKTVVFENFMTICVLINTIILSMDRHNIDPYTDFVCTLFNLVFTYIFCMELLLKLAGLGIKKYFKDLMNYLDTAVVILSLIEIVVNSAQQEQNGGKSISKGSLSAFRAVRIFRTFRVLRVARLLRQLRSMQIIIGVIQRSIKSFIYIAFLLLIFVYIYALLGMTLFGDIVKYPVGQNLSNGNQGPVSRQNFKDFHNSFISVFTLLTIENWNYLLFDTMYYSNIHQSVIAIYFVSWIFIGNFILLNLFLAILLDSFLVEEEEEEEQQLQQDEKLKQIEKKSSKRFDKAKEQKAPSVANLRRKTEQPLNDLILMLKNQNQPSSKNQSSGISLLKRAQTTPVQSSKEPLSPGNILSIFGLQNKDQQNDLPIYFEEMEPEDKMRIIIRHGIAQNQKKIRMNNIKDLYKDIQCENSLYILPKNNKMRKFFLKLVKHRFFERAILSLIVSSSVKLAIDTYYLNDEQSQQLLSWIDISFTAAFFIEAFVKIIAFGFVIDHGSYLRETWNILDFFIVASSFFDLFLNNISIPSLKVLRLLRILRPLRFITHNTAMKILVVALFESIGSIINVIIVVIVAWLMFAILGMSFFSGKFFYCSIDKYQNHTESECVRNKGQWLRYGSNFDDIIRSMLTLFVVSSLENWVDVLYQAVDATIADNGPIQDNFPPYAFYFVIFILIGTFFFLNFFIGVLFLNFQLAQRKILNQDRNKISITQNAEENPSKVKKQDYEKYIFWKDIQAMIINAKPDFETTNIPEQPWRKVLHYIVSSKVFEIFIITSIFFNMISLAATYNGASREYLETLDTINIVFTSIFALEATLKIIAYRETYFLNFSNVFDFGIILSSLIEIFMSLVQKNQLKIVRTAPQVVRILRVLRVTRIVRLIGKYKGIQALISTIMFSLPPLFNVFSLLMIIFFIFAILGVFLFSDIVSGQIIDQDYMNFQNFGVAMLMLFRISTGEDWNYVMYDTMDQKNCKLKSDCVSSFAPVYFISFVLICTYVMLNLFVLVILQQFDKYYLPSDNVISKFKNDLQGFKEIWQQFTMHKYNCQKIRDSKIIPFMTQLKEPLGLSNQLDDMEIAKELLSLGIRTELDGYVYFNEMLYRCMRRVYGNMKLDQEMQANEIKTQIKIQKMTLKQMRKIRLNLFDKHLDKEAVMGILKQDKIFNPLVQKFFARLGFTTWLRYSRKQTMIDFNTSQQDDMTQQVELEYDSDEEVLILDEDCDASEESQQINSYAHETFESKFARLYGGIQNQGSSSSLSFKSREKIQPFSLLSEPALVVNQVQNIKSQKTSRLFSLPKLFISPQARINTKRINQNQDSSLSLRNNTLENDNYYILNSHQENQSQQHNSQMSLQNLGQSDFLNSLESLRIPNLNSSQKWLGGSLTSHNYRKRLGSNMENVEIIEEVEEPPSATGKIIRQNYKEQQPNFDNN